MTILVRIFFFLILSSMEIKTHNLGKVVQLFSHSGESPKFYVSL